MCIFSIVLGLVKWLVFLRHSQYQDWMEIFFGT